jgi:hypothetical protein
MGSLEIDNSTQSIQGEKAYFNNIHLTLLEVDNIVIDLRDITIFEEIKQ